VKLYGYWRSLATFRVRIALNLKGLPYEETMVNLPKGEQFLAEYKAVNPQSVLPALIDGDGPPLFQSMAILEYLDETHPQPPLLPRAARDRARVRALAMIVAADAHPLVIPRIRNYLNKQYGVDEKAAEDWCRHWIGRACEALEANLASDPRTGRFCHGDAPTLADICLTSHLAGANLFKVDLTPYPNCKRISDNCLAIEAFAKAHPLKQPGAPANI
jgi:maleylacetoacetate isomerase